MVAPASRRAVQKLTLLRPSVVMSSTKRTRCFSRFRCGPRSGRCDPKPFASLLSYILHVGSISRRFRHPGGKWNAGGLAASHQIELLEPDVALDLVFGAEVDQRRTPHARKRDQPPAIGIDRARPARRENKGLVGHEARTASTSISIFAVSSAITFLSANPVIVRFPSPGARHHLPLDGLAAAIEQCAFVRSSDLDLDRCCPRRFLQRDFILIRRQAVMAGSVERGKGFQSLSSAPSSSNTLA